MAAILRIDLKWREIRSKVIFGHSKLPICKQIILLNVASSPWARLS